MLEQSTLHLQLQAAYARKHVVTMVEAGILIQKIQMILTGIVLFSLLVIKQWLNTQY